MTESPLPLTRRTRRKGQVHAAAGWVPAIRECLEDRRPSVLVDAADGGAALVAWRTVNS